MSDNIQQIKDKIDLVEFAKRNGMLPKRFNGFSLDTTHPLYSRISQAYIIAQQRACKITGEMLQTRINY